MQWRMYAVELKSPGDKQQYENEMKFRVSKSMLRVGNEVVVRTRLVNADPLSLGRFGREYAGVLRASAEGPYDFVLHTARRSPDKDASEAEQALEDLFLPLIMHHDGLLFATPVASNGAVVSELPAAAGQLPERVPLVPIGYVLEKHHARRLRHSVSLRKPEDYPSLVAA